MGFLVCGLNHKTAPLETREAFALSAEKQKDLLDALFNLSTVHEVVILSTCNRTEIYCETSHPDVLLPWLAKSQHFSLEAIQPFMYLYQDHEAIQHLLLVSCGLDSMMLGEPQIFGQMKQAFHYAESQNTVGPHLRGLFQFVFGASKRIRNQSGINEHATSIAFAASKLIQQHFNHQDFSVLLIGTGETASLVAKYLYQQGIRQFIIASRSEHHSRQLAAPYLAQAVAISDLPQALVKADAVVSATACPYPFISVAMVREALSQRQNTPLFFLDLAMPRDIEPQVGHLSQVTLYHLDDLQRITQEGMQQREAAARHAEKLIAFELKELAAQHRALRAKELICDYRNTMQILADQELQRARQHLEKGEDPYAVLSALSQRLIKKFSHIPSIGLRQAALDERDEILDLAKHLFHSTLNTYEDFT